MWGFSSVFHRCDFENSRYKKFYHVYSALISLKINGWPTVYVNSWGRGFLLLSILLKNAQVHGRKEDKEWKRLIINSFSIKL